MDSDSRTWMVLVRDVSRVIRIQDQPAVFITLVLDVDTGLVLGSSIGASPAQATHEAFETALAAAPPPLSAGPPARVLCKGEDLGTVVSQLRLLVEGDTPPVEEIIPGEEAEAIFDSLIDHLTGRPRAT